MMAHACNFKKVMTTYLSQSVNGLIGLGTETTLVGEAGDGAQVATTDGAGKALDAPTCSLTVGTGARFAIERADAATTPWGQLAPASRVRESRHQV
jgi:hypothetical protein